MTVEVSQRRSDASNVSRQWARPAGEDDPWEGSALGDPAIGKGMDRADVMCDQDQLRLRGRQENGFVLCGSQSPTVPARYMLDLRFRD